MDSKLDRAKEILNKGFLLNAQSRKEALRRGENVMTTEDMDFLMSFEINLYRVPTFGRLNHVTRLDNDSLIALLKDAKKQNSWADFSETVFSEENKKMLKKNNCIRISFKKPFNRDIIFFSEEMYIKYLILQFQELLSGLGSALD
jgi:hypothetical protein